MPRRRSSRSAAITAPRRRTSPISSACGRRAGGDARTHAARLRRSARARVATYPLMRDALRRKTAPGVLAERARGTPHAVAYRAKKLGLYRDRTWREYAALVGRVADGFAKLGLQRGERVTIIGDACEEWVLADMAAQALGAVTYGIYPTASAAETEYQ